MTAERTVNVQDAFLNYLRKNKVTVTIFLLNGVKLNGMISCFDQNVIVLKKDGYTQLIYKHAISTFCPHGVIGLFGWGSQPEQESAHSKTEDVEDDLGFEEGFEDDEEYS
jgi:host factor-I protein